MYPSRIVACSGISLNYLKVQHNSTKTHAQDNEGSVPSEYVFMLDYQNSGKAGK